MNQMRTYRTQSDNKCSHMHCKAALYCLFKRIFWMSGAMRCTQRTTMIPFFANFLISLYVVLMDGGSLEINK